MTAPLVTALGKTTVGFTNMKSPLALLKISSLNELISFRTVYDTFFRYSKIISNTRFLSKIPRQTRQTQIRLLLKKQSDQGLPCLLF